MDVRGRPRRGRRVMKSVLAVGSCCASARTLTYPFSVHTSSSNGRHSQQTVAALLWSWPLASEEGLAEARRTLEELTGVVPEEQPSSEQLSTLFSRLHGGVWRCTRRVNGHEQLMAMGVGRLQRAAMLGVSQKLKYTALEGRVLYWKYMAAGLIETHERLELGNKPLETHHAGKVSLFPIRIRSS